jgi:hypothetical protein
MQLPPLQLKHYFFTETSVKANDHKGGQTGWVYPDGRWATENAEKPNEYQLSLTVTTLKEGAVCI